VIGIRQVRIVCGLVLFSYLISHYVNHALGNISFAAMETGLVYHRGFWRNPIVAFVFYTAAITHWGLGLWALYERRQFRYPLVEIAQLVLGVSIPLLLVIHFVGNRLQQPLFGRDLAYANVMIAYWVNRPYVHWIQYALIVVVWTHGCIGLHYWLRLKPWFAKAAPYLLAFAVLLPTLALLGLVQGAREAIALNAQPEWKAAHFGPGKSATPAERALMDEIIFQFPFYYAGVLLIIFAARGARVWRERRGGVVSLSYANGRVVRVPNGTSVLEASLRHGIPHASVCGGKARCSTCRIRVIGNLRDLPKPSRREAFVLERVGASADPAVRLACQLRPLRDLKFDVVFLPHLTAETMHRATHAHSGEERYLVCMFVDMRHSTALAEKRLPFDTMFLINRFVQAVSRAVEEAGGQPNQFLGDGVLALFGLECAPEVACRQALAAIERIAANVDRLNAQFAEDLPQPIRFGIGVNGGEVIVGDVGYKDRVVFTALGDAVNVAARLQDLTKELDCEALVSEDVWRRAGIATGASAKDVAIRGRSDPLSVRVVTSRISLQAD
jgi:adenylate cyclase